MLDGVLKHRAGPTETVAGIEQAIDLRSVPRPLLDIVEIAQVGDQRIGGVLVEVNVVGLRIAHGPDNRPIGPDTPASAQPLSQLRTRKNLAKKLRNLVSLSLPPPLDPQGVKSCS